MRIVDLPAADLTIRVIVEINRLGSYRKSMLKSAGPSRMNL